MASSVKTNAQDKNKPVEIEAHESELARRAKAQAKKQKSLRKTLKADAASEAEAAKDRNQYKVSAEIKGGRKEMVVTAQNENDAWAGFCDQNKTWPGPNWCEREIVKV